MPKLILDRQVKYNGETYSKGEPVPVKEKDMPEFENSGMIERVKGDFDEYLLLDNNSKDKLIEKLNKENEKLKAEIDRLNKENEQFKKEYKSLKKEVKKLEEEIKGSEQKERVPKDDLESKTSTELYELTKELEIEGRTKLRNDKQAMITAIREKRQNKENEGE